MSGEKSGYSRWDLKFLLGEIGFFIPSPKWYHGSTAGVLPMVEMRALCCARLYLPWGQEMSRVPGRPPDPKTSGMLSGPDPEYRPERSLVIQDPVEKKNRLARILGQAILWITS